MNIDELPEDSDTSDEDYDPGEKQEVHSEVDSDGDPEDPLSGSDEPDDNIQKGKKKTKTTKRKKKVDETKAKALLEAKDVPKEDDPLEKKKKEDLWADFMKETGFQSKDNIKSTYTANLKRNHSSVSTIVKKIPETSTSQTPSKPADKVKITQVFEFAGEEVKVEKEVAADSAEARLLVKSSDSEVLKTSRGKRSGGLSGISNVLSQLSKKPKISTLDKTKLDWERFKKEENIEEELQTHNKGKDGYLDRQDFLERADLRRFEIEKEIRNIERNKRFNSTL